MSLRRTAFLAAAFIVIAAPTAGAAIALSFTPASAPPGAEVTLTSEGMALGDPESGFNLYLAPSQRVADAVTGPDRPRHPALVPLGHFDGEMASGQSVTFTVPDVDAGRYVMVVHCECDGAGGTISAVEEFEVASGVPIPRTNAPTAILALVAAALIGAGALALLAVRRFG